MEKVGGKYALVQFSPVPERMEFLNIGVILMVPKLEFMDVKISQSPVRMERFFGKQASGYIQMAKQSFERRLREEMKIFRNEEDFCIFASKRANDVRLSPLMSLTVTGDPKLTLDRLFKELVGTDVVQTREPRIRAKLRKAFVHNHVEHFLDKPDHIELPEYGIKIAAPFGYQNGFYNLIDGINIPDDVPNGLREVGKKAIEGNLLWKHFSADPKGRKRLVCVGDFSKQSSEFYNAAKDQMEDANIKLYRLDDLNSLYADIKQNAALHS